MNELTSHSRRPGSPEELKIKSPHPALCAGEAIPACGVDPTIRSLFASLSELLPVSCPARSRAPSRACRKRASSPFPPAKMAKARCQSHATTTSGPSGDGDRSASVGYASSYVSVPCESRWSVVKTSRQPSSDEPILARGFAGKTSCQAERRDATT